MRRGSSPPSRSDIGTPRPSPLARVVCGVESVRVWSAVLRCYGATVLGATWVIKNRRKKGAGWWNSAGPLQFRHCFFFGDFFFFPGDIKYAVVFGDKSRKSTFSAIAYGVRAYWRLKRVRALPLSVVES